MGYLAWEGCSHFSSCSSKNCFMAYLVNASDCLQWNKLTVRTKATKLSNIAADLEKLEEGKRGERNLARKSCCWKRKLWNCLSLFLLKIGIQILKVQTA